MLRNVEKKVAIGAEMLRMVFPSKYQHELHHHISPDISQHPCPGEKNVAICSHICLIQDHQKFFWEYVANGIAMYSPHTSSLDFPAVL